MCRPCKVCRGLVAGAQRGTTLLELLLALSVLAVVAAVVYGSLRATVSAIEQTTASGAPAQQARVVLARLADELASADWSKKQVEKIFVGTSQKSGGRSRDGLSFTSRSHVWYPTQAPAIQRALIDYALEPTAGAFRLWRTEMANPYLLTVEPERYVVADGVAGLRFRYFDDGEWVEQWNAAEAEKLPELVEVVIAFISEGGTEEEFMTMIEIPREG